MKATKKNIVKVVARIAVYATGKEALLFLVDDCPVNYGCIGCYAHVGQHSEADMGFYTQNTRLPENKAERDEIANLINEYKNIVAAHSDDIVEVGQRINWNIVRKNWA